MAATSHFSEGRVRAARDVEGDVRMIEIEPSRGARPYATGSHLDIAVIIDELPDIRSYSLVGERPVDGAYRIAVKDVPDIEHLEQRLEARAAEVDLGLQRGNRHGPVGAVDQLEHVLDEHLRRERRLDEEVLDRTILVAAQQHDLCVLDAATGATDLLVVGDRRRRRLV